MIRDLRTDPADSPIAADVCIVGAGAAGLTLAVELSAWARVVVLEAGGAHPDDSPTSLTRGEVCGLPFEGLEQGRVWSFGGTTTVWGGQCVEIDDIAFERRPWVPHSGWPFGRRHLEPFYARARQLLGLPDRVHDRLARRFERRRPSFDERQLDCRISAVAPGLDVGLRYRDALASSGRVQVLLHAHVCEIGVNGSCSAVSAVDVRTLEGRPARVTAPAVVLCAGGIENARLLLLSNRAEAAGLGNRHDLVGRFFQEHPTFEIGPLVSTPRRAVRNAFAMLRHGSLRFLPRAHLSDDIQRREHTTGCVADVAYEHDLNAGLPAVKTLAASIRERRWPRHTAATAWRIVRDSPSLAVEAYRRLARGIVTAPASSAPRLQVHLEQSPNPTSRVSLSRERDALGLNRARVDWRLTDLDRRTARVMAATAAVEFARIGVLLDLAEWRRIDEAAWPASVLEAYHHMGTTRMADTPANGVVDANCQVHGISGLFVCGSSVFPTAGSANPTLTIVALAVRLADHLRRIRNT